MSVAEGHERQKVLVVDDERALADIVGSYLPSTRTEFDILDLLSSQPRTALSRRQIIDHVWDSAWVGDEHVVDVHVANLRRKIGDDPGEPRFNATVRGVGYRMGPG
jgi:DNA-binding response OmpR family regulator